MMFLKNMACGSPPARLVSARFGTFRLESARLGSARLGEARPAPARLGSARLGLASARLGSAGLKSARLETARPGSARFGSVRFGPAALVPGNFLTPGTVARRRVSGAAICILYGLRRVLIVTLGYSVFVSFIVKCVLLNECIASEKSHTLLC